MRFTLATLTILGAVVSASASNAVRQAAPPACLAPCIADTSNNDGCGGDVGCLCRSTKYITASTACASQACQGSDLTAALEFAKAACIAAGVTLSAVGPTAGSSSTAPHLSGSHSSTVTPPAPTRTPGAASALKMGNGLGLGAVGLIALAL